MAFNANVKETGYLFEAINDSSSTRAVSFLEENTSYWGFLYPGKFEDARAADVQIVFECTEDRKEAIFPADALEQVSIPLLIKTARSR